LGEADHGKAAGYRSNRGFVITQSNFKRFFESVAMPGRPGGGMDF